MADEERPSSGGKSFWATLPGVLTGLAGLVTAIGSVLALVLTQGDGTTQVENRPQPSPTVSVAPTQEPTLDLTSPDPAEASPISALSAPSSGCPTSPNAFWMEFQSFPYGPFGNGYYMAWDVYGSHIWDPLSGWLTYPDPQVRNSWVNLRGTPFNGCVAGAGAPVFGQYTG